jgi:hypothetical protein
VNAYVLIQQALVAARHDALRAEADTTRLLSSARPLPAVSADGRAAGTDRLASAARPVARPRSLGAAAAADRLPAADATRDGHPVAGAGRASAGEQRLGGGGCDCGCAKGIAPAA